MIEMLKISSKAIKDFPMGDAHERICPVYLPPNYDKKRKEPYPVVVFLAGWSSKGSSYLSDESAFGIPLQTRFDRAIGEGRMPAFIGAFPDGTSKLGCSQYINSPSLGNYGDYICDEITSLIDKEFHTYSSANFRAVTGHSSGGFGALVSGFLRPDRFQFVCSSAGDSFYEALYLPSVNLMMSELEKSGSLVKFVEDFLNHPNPKSLPRSKGEALMSLSMAACYAPNPSKAPLFGDLFFEPTTGKIIPEIWKKYLEWDPIHMVEKNIQNIKKLKFILLEAGLQDEYGLQWGHRQLAEKFKKHGVSFEINEYPGTHSGQNWRFEPRLINIFSKMFS